jgi:hypothetical protein
MDKVVVALKLTVAAVFVMFAVAWMSSLAAAQAQGQTSLPIEIVKIAPVKLDQPARSIWRDILTGPVLSGIASAIASTIVALVGVKMALRNTQATLYQKSNEAEVKELQARLNEFYGPFHQISRENELVSREFRDRHKKHDPDFRTLIALLDEQWRAALDKSDRALIDRMIQNGADLRKLIRDKSGLVDVKIVPILAKAAAHFAVLEMASKGELEAQPGRFDTYVYPRDLDPAIEKEIDRLNDRIRTLLSEPGEKHPPMRPLSLLSA